jgi:hypothetical protein
VRTAYRIVTTTLAVAAAFPIGLPTAHADASAALLVDSNWFWHDQFDGQIGPSGVGQRMPGAASGTPDGEIGVGYTNGKSATGSLTPDAPQNYPEDTPNKEAYLRWATIPFGATLTSFTFKLPLDTQRSTPQPQTPIKLVACAAINDWPAGQPPYGDPYSGKPQDDCTVSAEGAWDAAASTYSFDVTNIAQGWLTSGLNLGLGLRQKPGEKQVFQFNADPLRITAMVDYIVPPPEPTTVPQPPAPGPVVLPPVAAPAPVVPFVPQPAPAPAPAPAPVVSQPTTPATVPQAATVPFDPDLRPNGALWAALLLGVLLLGVTSLLLGNPDAAPVTTAGPATPLGRALRQRQDATSSWRTQHA